MHSCTNRTCLPLKLADERLEHSKKLLTSSIDQHILAGPQPIFSPAGTCADLGKGRMEHVEPPGPGLFVM